MVQVTVEYTDGRVKDFTMSKYDWERFMDYFEMDDSVLQYRVHNL